MNKRGFRKVRTGLHYFSAVLVALLFLLPIYWAGVTSLRKSAGPPVSAIEWYPTEPSVENYFQVFRVVPMIRYLTNSLLIVAAAVPITILSGSLAGLAMVFYPPETRYRLLQLTIVLLLIPGAAVWLFRFQIMGWLGLLDTLWALILPSIAATSPLYVLLYYWSFLRLPDNLFEAARMDGASPIQSWRWIGLPLVKPATVGVAILSFLFYWGDFISPVLYLFDPNTYTLPIGLQILNQLGSTNWPILMAGAMLITIPVILLFALLQRFFLHGFSIANLFDRN